MCYKSLFKLWRYLYNQQNNSKRQFEIAANLMQTFEKPPFPKLLNRILRLFTLIVLRYVYRIPKIVKIPNYFNPTIIIIIKIIKNI